MKTAQILMFSIISILATICLAQPQPVSTGPLTLQDVNIMMRRNVGRDMTEADLAARIQRYGIAFTATPEVIGRLRFNGAHPHLLNTIKHASEKYAPSPEGASTNSGADPIIEEVRKNVKDYVDGLPDFICTQEVQRSIDTDGSGSWQKMDELVYELTYNRKQESYKLTRTNGLASPQKSGVIRGARSAGEFASALDSLFDPETGTVFKPAGKEKLGAHQALIYDYHVTKSKSKLSISIEDDPPFIAAYSGSVWIDAQTKQVLRIEQAIEDPPAQYRLFSGDRIVDYEMVKLRGAEVEVLLPVKAEVMMLDRSRKGYSRNLIYFKFYRKFESDVKIIEGSDEPEKSEKPEKPAGITR